MKNPSNSSKASTPRPLVRRVLSIAYLLLIGRLILTSGPVQSANSTLPNYPQVDLGAESIGYRSLENVYTLNPDEQITFSHAVITPLTGTNAGEFELDSWTPSTGGSPMDPHGIYVYFSPQQTGQRAAVLTLNFLVGPPTNLLLIGTGLPAAPPNPPSPSSPPPTPATPPSAVDFGSVSVGSNATRAVYHLTDYQAVNLSTVDIAGPNFSDFSLSNDSAQPLPPVTGPATILNDVIIVFTPQMAGPRSATVTMTFGGSPSSSIVIRLTGTGLTNPTPKPVSPTPAGIPSPTINKLVWTANGLYLFNTQPSDPTPLLMGFVNRLYSNHPNARASAVVAFLHTLLSQSAYPPGRSLTANAQALLPLVKRLTSPAANAVPSNLGVEPAELARLFALEAARVALPPVQHGSRITLQQGLPTSHSFLAVDLSTVQRGSPTLAYRDVSAFRPYDSGVLGQAWEIFRQNPASRDVYRSFSTFTVHPDSRTSTILSTNNVLKGLVDSSPSVRQLIASPDYTAAKASDIYAAFDDFAAKISSDTLNTIKGLSPAHTAAARPARTQQVDPLQVLQQVQNLAEGERSFVSLASGIVDLLPGDGGPLQNPGASLGQTIESLGNSVVDLQQAVGEFSELTDLGSSLGSAVSLGTTLMSGDIVGLGLDLMSFTGWGGDNSSAQTQMILNEINGLKQDVTQLQKQMNGRFDQVDARLNVIYQTMTSGFDTLSQALDRYYADTSYKLDSLQQDLGVAYTQLLEQDRKLTRIETDVQVYALALAKNQIEDEIDAALSYPYEYPTPPNDPLAIDKFKSYLQDFTAHAVNDSFSATWTDQQNEDHLPPAPVDDAEVIRRLDNLTESGLAQNLPFLARLAATSEFQNGDLQGNQQLANPLLWAMTAQAYIRLLQDWPAYADLVSTFDLDRIAPVGERLQTVVRNIASKGSAAQPQPRAEFFQRLLDRYGNALQLLRGSIDSILVGFQNGPAKGFDVLTAGADWDGVAERNFGPPVVDPGVLQMKSTDPAHFPDTLAVPSGVVALIDPWSKASTELQLMRPNFAYTVGWVLDHVTTDQEYNGTYTVALMDVKRYYYRVQLQILWSDQGQKQYGRLLSFTITAPPGTEVLREEDWYRDFDGELYQAIPHDVDLGSLFSKLWPQISATPSPQIIVANAGYNQTAQRIADDVKRQFAALADDLTKAVDQAYHTQSPVMEQGTEIVSAANASRLSKATDALTAAKLLLKAYSALGIPGLMQTDDTLRSYLYGSTGWPLADRSFLDAHVSPGSPLLQFAWQNDNLGNSLKQFSSLLMNRLASTGGQDQSLPVIWETVDGLSLMKDVQTVLGPPSSPSGGRQ